MSREANNTLNDREKNSVDSEGTVTTGVYRRSQSLVDQELQDQVRENLSRECSLNILVKIASVYKVATESDLKRLDDSQLLDEIVAALDEEDIALILAEEDERGHYTNKISLCTWCSRPFSRTNLRSFYQSSFACRREVCKESRANARKEYESIWGRCRELNDEECEQFGTALGIPEDELHREVFSIGRVTVVREVIIRLNSRDSWLSELREIDTKYRKGRDLSELYESFFDRVEIVCDWCGEPYSTIWRYQKTSPYCETPRCKEAREKTFNEYQYTYGVTDFRLKSNVRRLGENLNRVLGMPIEDANWMVEALQSPVSSLDRIKFLDEKYRKGLDVSHFHETCFDRALDRFFDKFMMWED